METVVKYNGNNNLSKDDINTLVNAGIIPKGTPESQVKLFAKVCYEKNLSPFSKQIHLIGRRAKVGNGYETRYTFQTAIDGFRAIAERTGAYAGSDDYKFDEGLNEYEMIKDNRSKPTTATATIYKLVGGVRCPFTATIRWEEYYPGDAQGFMWKKMPFLMAGKCAEALALRKAFPESLGGIYSNEEMMQANNESKDKEPEETNTKEINAEALEIFEPLKEINDKINHAKSVDELMGIYNAIPKDQQHLYLEKLSIRKGILKANRNYTEEARKCLTNKELNYWFSSLTEEEKKKAGGVYKNRIEEIKEYDKMGKPLEA